MTRVAVPGEAIRPRAFALGGFLWHLIHLALGNPCRFSAAIAQVIELGATDDAATLDLDGFDHRRIDRENPLHTFTKGNLADREALVDAATLTGDADTFISLNALALALLDLHIDADGVARLKVWGRPGSAQTVGFFLFQGLDQVHDYIPCLPGLIALCLLIGEMLRPQVRSPLPRGLFPLCLPPLANLGMMTAQKHIGDIQAFKGPRSRVLRVF